MADPELRAEPFRIDRRHAGLDGLRGLAILLVLALHMTRLSPGRDFATDLWIGVVRMGWVGVDLFFVLSGFLITSLLVGSRGRPRYWRNFYVRRALRIVPLYWLVLILVLHVMPHLEPLKRFEGFWLETGPISPLWYWTWCSNLRVAWTGEFHHQLLGITWSLAIEEQFYLIWPLVVARLNPV